MILIRKTLLLPRSCSMNNMTPGPSPMTSVFLNLRAQLILAALSLTKSCSHLTGRNTLLEPPALFLDGEPPPRVAALPRRLWWSIHVRKPAFWCGLLGIRVR